MLSLFDYQRQPRRLADRLPWFGLEAETPCVLRHKDGTLQHSLRVQPPDTATWTAGDIQAHAARINNVVRRFGTGWGVFLEYAKRADQDYPDTSWPTEAARAADAERATYYRTTPHFRLDTHATLVWLPRAIREQKAWQWFTRGGGPGASPANVTRAFQDQVQRGADLLTSCLRTVQPLGPQGTLTYLHGRVSTEQHPIAVPDVPAYLDCLLTDRDFVPGMEPALIIAPKPGAPARGRWQDRFIAQHLRTFTITGFPGGTYPDMLAALLTLPCEWVYAVRWLPLDAKDAYKVMKSQAGLWKQGQVGMVQRGIQRIWGSDAPAPEPDREAVVQEESLAAAMDACIAGEVTYGYLTATVTVWDLEPAVADERRREIERVITGKGFSCHTEHLGATEAWLSSLPGLCYPNVRRPMVSSLNFAHCWLGGLDTGTPWDAHLQAPALARLETASRVPYHLVLHDHGMGHALIIGPGGSGKTTFVEAAALWFQRYHALGSRIRLFDKKGDLAPLTRANGGADYTLRGDGQGVNFQPLYAIDNEQERQWAAVWVEGLCREQQQPCTPGQKRELWEALCGLAGMAGHHRTLTSLWHLVQDAGLRQALRPYTALMEGGYGQVLDAVTPPLTLARWARFETETLLQTPPLIGPTLGVLFHQLGQSFRERVPTYLALDEAWKYLTVVQMLGQIDEWLRELRHLRVNIVFATQDPSEILNSPIAGILMNQCQIRVFLPNPHAAEGQNVAAYTAFGLNARQIDLLAQGLPHRDYLIQTPQGMQLVELALGPQQLKILTEGVVP